VKKRKRKKNLRRKKLRRRRKKRLRKRRLRVPKRTPKRRKRKMPKKKKRKKVKKLQRNSKDIQKKARKSTNGSMPMMTSQLIQFLKPQSKKPTLTTAPIKPEPTESHIQMPANVRTLKMIKINASN